MAAEAETASTEPLLKTPFHARHVAAGARMVPFAGYDMPVQYPAGIMAEHNWTRESAGLFDVSHMGQAFLVGPDHETTARALEALIPADIVNLPPGKQRYSQLLNEEGGILDDLMVTRSADPDEDGALLLVVNAACKTQDYAHIEARLPANVKLVKAEHRGLIALQGPKAEEALAALNPEAAEMGFMTLRTMKLGGVKANVSRSGYTGEDGYEISAAADRIGEIWDALLLDARVKPIGLGARDSLRLEAGLCLYGHDIDTTTSPVEAALNWSIQKRRREEGGFPGAARIQREFAEKPARVRVGLLPEGRAPAREGAEIATADGTIVGKVTSGGFGPTLNGPCAMGYVAREHSAPGTRLDLIVRGKPLPATIAAMPFVPNRYKR
ncbi:MULTISPECIES: glycine cleavage system aminomethyltransferase GcvT [unclassified Bosea (in: a-proteobacteria)]|uniref:glycine cleavage system aminomethyltransferase GcvT n=1 Tax=unclassified Bosea (in: a-proteobacteria) TaxID=2653178 RepID=UPI000F760376|nr:MULTISPECIES: glycine cleavage system aminomethyltransferase GcvT [unclassified Bosea (in: a-proteobacteria)]AZO78748.1 glycine cleavage system protein T [Bosea sp. Tri-49]RXT17465.1 glycine cleavage system protein T [Bosea sp. Tri-39]RXT40836.1 glycine cleavage system protein T [Bosea sp. Tri-54]